MHDPAQAAADAGTVGRHAAAWRPEALIDFPADPGGPGAGFAVGPAAGPAAGPADEGAARLRLAFGAPRRRLTAWRLDEVAAVIDAAHAEARAGAWAIGHVAYEAAPAFDAAFRVCPAEAAAPLAAFAIFDAPDPRGWPLPPADSWQAGPWQDPLSPPAFERAVQDIHAAIADGEVYQVNLTTRLSTQLRGDALAWFLALHRAQPQGYAVWLPGPGAVPDGASGVVPGAVPEAIASVSPELFFSWRDGRLLAQPMKGTAPRGPTPAADAAAAAALRSSEKERAENLMIVDLLRNDFARVAELGSVSVPRLFELHALPTVWQMTSTVAARTRPGLRLSEVFAALFPCGSVTGAPKIQAMKKIAALEGRPRGVYCGALGAIAPGGAATFNVPIRTAVLGPAGPAAAGIADARPVVCGIGSGITLDASVAGEAAEWRAKRRFLLRADAPFALLESLRLDHGRIWLLEEHLQRLQRSARALGRACDADTVRQRLLQEASAQPTGVHKLRLLLADDGTLRLESAPLAGPGAVAFAPADETLRLTAPWQLQAQALAVSLARQPIDAADEFLLHKTTRRAAYEAHAPAPGAFDVLLWNARGELTEFTLGNVALCVAGRWLTPPLACGLLPGCYRAALLSAGALTEAVLGRADLHACEAAAFFNSVRGWLPLRPDVL